MVNVGTKPESLYPLPHGTPYIYSAGPPYTIHITKFENGTWNLSKKYQQQKKTFKEQSFWVKFFQLTGVLVTSLTHSSGPAGSTQSFGLFMQQTFHSSA